MVDRRLFCSGLARFFLIVLNANGEAAVKRSCVLTGASCNTLSSAQVFLRLVLKTDRGVIAGLASGIAVCGVLLAALLAGWDHGRRVSDESDRDRSCWNSSCARSMAACVEYVECLLDWQLSCWPWSSLFSAGAASWTARCTGSALGAFVATASGELKLTALGFLALEPPTLLYTNPVDDTEAARGIWTEVVEALYVVAGTRM
jgi:hypothetical protein